MPDCFAFCRMASAQRGRNRQPGQARPGQGRAGRGLSGLGYASVRRTKEEKKKKKNGESDAPNATTDNNELRNKRGRERHGTTMGQKGVPPRAR